MEPTMRILLTGAAAAVALCAALPAFAQGYDPDYGYGPPATYDYGPPASFREAPDYYAQPGYNEYGQPGYNQAPMVAPTYEGRSAAEEPDDADSIAYCQQRFRSYDPASGTYLGYDGIRHPCP
jgi:hypothetical protein